MDAGPRVARGEAAGATRAGDVARGTQCGSTQAGAVPVTPGPAQCAWLRGSFTVKVEPTPSSLSTEMEPPWASTICRTM